MTSTSESSVHGELPSTQPEKCRRERAMSEKWKEIPAGLDLLDSVDTLMVRQRLRTSLNVEGAGSEYIVEDRNGRRLYTALKTEKAQAYCCPWKTQSFELKLVSCTGFHAVQYETISSCWNNVDVSVPLQGCIATVRKRCSWRLTYDITGATNDCFFTVRGALCSFFAKDTDYEIVLKYRRL
ncbi:unnamed protein product [Acanthoscelides obtectus]|uniref:Phospholipid scramblase n=1 Tax=Acanthoscelides obtectus TaxID=200917 RepID=A0A9P0L288_ACAOB|nr:unnamed protein product [Acanthoscelides obtectus]CAK1645307.1 hypothetical protein AOBTE_LOCUS14077 [Acanthoscelides obtectus]